MEFRNIIVPFQIHLDNLTIEKLMPQELKQKILLHANAALRSRQDSLHYIEQFNKNIFIFLQSKLNIELGSIIKLESSAGNAIIKKAELKIQYYKIGNRYNVSFPNSFSIEISCSLMGNEHALKGEILFYHHDFRTFLLNSLSEFANNIE